jgi:caa(3)-type oxidase subunit IV
MSDQENFNEAPTPIDPNTAPEPLKEAQQQNARELRDVPVEEVPTEKLPVIAKEVKEGESEPVREARRQTEAILNKPVEAIEDAVNEADQDEHPRRVEAELPHLVSSTTVIHLGGREIVVNQPVYTVVFGALAIITIIEVASAEIFPDGFLLTIWLAGLSISKALMVMWFYMHLKDDSRIFAIAIALPLIIAGVATLFLTAVPPFGY